MSTHLTHSPQGHPMITLRALLESMVRDLKKEEIGLFFAAQNTNLTLTQSLLLETKSRVLGGVADDLLALLERDAASRVVQDRIAREADTQM